MTLPMNRFLMKKRKAILTFLVVMFSTIVALASTNPVDTNQTKVDSVTIREDDPVLKMLDKLAQTPYYEANVCILDTDQLNIFNFSKDSVPAYDDAFYEQHIAQLDSMTPFNLVYNDRVKAFINLYTVKRREQTSRMLGLKHYYFPLFEQILDQYNIPIEMKYLAIVESAMNPQARSHAGATGLWQFMYSTGKLFGLNQNSYMDERMDPIKSTHAACKYMQYLYDIYGKWDLVLAAYNCGPGNVNKAMRRAGTSDGNYWDIYPFLPRETRGYVPAFIAVNYVMENASAHNLYPVAPEANFFEVDTIHVNKPVSLEEIAEIIDESVDYLSFLNPSYKMKFIPAYSNKTNYLVLPTEKIGLFVQNEELVYENSAKEENDGKELTQKFSEDRVIYRVKSGDYLGKIAQQYHVSVSNLRAWNGLRNNNIRAGQKLVIYPRGSYAQPKTSSTTEKPKEEVKVAKDGNYVYYTIQQGDTLWDIAKARGISVDELKKLNGNMNYRDLKPGMKVIVGSGS